MSTDIFTFMKSACTKCTVLLLDFWYCPYKLDCFLSQHFAFYSVNGVMLVISHEA